MAWDGRWGRRRVARRELLGAAAASGAGLAAMGVAGCGPDDAPLPAPSILTPTPVPRDDVSGPPVRGGALRMVGGPLGSGLDIHRSRNTYEVLMWQWVGNFLFRYAATEPYLPEPDLAGGFPEIPGEGTLLTFKIRPEAKWQERAPANGRAVTAGDVKATFDRIRTLGPKSPRSGNYAGVEAIVAIDPQTVQFKLKAPQADFLNILADQYDIVIPQELAARGDDAVKTPGDVVGSGPYVLSLHEAGRRLQLRRRPDGYWRPETAWLDSWELLNVVDEGQKANTLFAGLADMADVTPVVARIFQGEKGFRVSQSPVAARECVLVNHAVVPFNDPRVRLALSRAVDRRSVYGAAYEGAGIAGGPITPAAPAWALSESELRALPGYGERDTELREARALLAAAGYPDGIDTTLLALSVSQLPRVAEALTSSLAEAGVRVTTEIVGADFAALQERARKGAFALAATQLLAGIYPDAQLYLYHHSKAGLANYGKYTNLELDAKLDRQRKIYDDRQRLPLVQEIQRDIINAPGPVWIGSRLSFLASSTRVRNATATPFISGYNDAESTWLKPA